MALPQTRAQAPTPALSASAARVKQTTDTRTATRPRTALPWQERALFYYDQIGELHFAAQFYARALSRVRLYPAYRNPEDGTLEPIESGPAVDLLEAVQDPGGGRSVLLSTYGQLMFVTGECYLLNTVEDDVQRWEVVSTDELKHDAANSSYKRRTAPSGAPTEYRAGDDEDFAPMDDEAIVYRLWRRHPHYSGWADSPMRAILDVAEELIMLTLAVRARARSRLAQSGILYVAQELAPAPVGVIGDDDPAADPFIDELTTHFVTPIEDEGTAAAVVPYVLRGPAMVGGIPAKDAIFHIKTHDPEETYPEAGLRTEAIKRIALGLDMPPEALLGMTDSNHWTAWQVQDQIWQSHLAPVCQAFCDDLTAVYLRPAVLDETGDPRAEEVVVAYDATELLTNPDQGKDANELYDRRAIGKASLRLAKGFDDDDAPDDDELAEMLAVALRDPSQLPGAPEAVSDGEIPQVADEPGEPVDGPEIVSERPDEASAKILGAVEMAIARCRELAGSRLRSKYRARPEMKVADGSPAGQVATLLGPITVEQIGADALDLVTDGSSALRSLLISWGYPETQATALGTMVEMFAARTLFEETPPPAPAGFAGFLYRSR